MKVRYSISEKWEINTIVKVMDAIVYAIDFYELEDPKSTLTVKLINGTNERDAATADRTKSKRYEVRLNYSQLDEDSEVLKALFHEMTHVKQFIHNGLRVFGCAAKWEGRDMPIKDKSDYWFSPWEMEARAMEDPMYAMFDEIN